VTTFSGSGLISVNGPGSSTFVLYWISQDSRMVRQFTHSINDILPRSPTLSRHLDRKLDIQIPFAPRTSNRHPLASNNQFLIMPYHSFSLFDFYTYPPSIEMKEEDSIET
jgi:hypothetical protein